MATQTALAALAPILGLLTITRLVRLWMVVILVIALGTVNAIDDSIRQTLVPEVVGPDLLRDAVGLNSVTTNAARAVGPARRSRKGRDAHSQSTGPSSAVPSSAMCGFFSKTARPRPGTGRLPAKSRTGTEAPCCRGPNASAGMPSEGPAASGAAGRIRVHRSVSAHQAVSLASRPSESRTRSRIDCSCQTPGSTSWAPSARVASASRSRTSAGMSSSRRGAAGVPPRHRRVQRGQRVVGRSGAVQPHLGEKLRARRVGQQPDARGEPHRGGGHPQIQPCRPAAAAQVPTPVLGVGMRKRAPGRRTATARPRPAGNGTPRAARYPGRAPRRRPRRAP